MGRWIAGAGGWFVKGSSVVGKGGDMTLLFNDIVEHYEIG
jgi:hypothetical protein